MSRSVGQLILRLGTKFVCENRTSTWCFLMRAGRTNSYQAKTCKGERLIHGIGIQVTDGSAAVSSLRRGLVATIHSISGRNARIDARSCSRTPLAPPSLIDTALIKTFIGVPSFSETSPDSPSRQRQERRNLRGCNHLKY